MKGPDTRTSSLYSTRHFTGNQWSSFSTAVMLRRSPRLTRSTTLAAERCTISRGDRRSRTGLRSRSQFAMSRGNGRGSCRLQCPSIFESWLCETGESRRLGRRSTPEPTYRVRCPESRRCHGWSAAAVQRPRKRRQWSHPELRGRWLNETRWLRFSIH